MAEGPFKACAALMAKREDAATTPNPNNFRRKLTIPPPECALCARLLKDYSQIRLQTGRHTCLTMSDVHENAIRVPRRPEPDKISEAACFTAKLLRQGQIDSLIF